MPKRKDIKKILVIGAGPIIIGQACEFDYSGTQACKALKDEGYKVILINSNPATIMTDPGVADKTYIEPVSLEVLEEVIKKEKPEVIIGVLGCMAQSLKDDLLENKPYVDIILGPDSYKRLPDLLNRNEKDSESLVDTKLSRF